MEIATTLKGQIDKNQITLVLETRGGLKDFDPTLKVGDMGVFFIKELNESEAKLAYWGSIATSQKPNFKIIDNNKNEQQSTNLTDEEYKIYSEVIIQLRQNFSERELLVLKKMTELHSLRNDGNDNWLQSLLVKDFGIANEELLKSFIYANHEPQALENRFDKSLDIVLISKEKIAELFNSEENGWAKFYANFPNAKGIIELSKIAFNYDKTKAIVSYGASFDRGKGGVGYYILLNKVDNKWVIAKKVMSWIA